MCAFLLVDIESGVVKDKKKKRYRNKRVVPFFLNIGIIILRSIFFSIRKKAKKRQV
jgi:hypothetical protein